MAQLAGSDGSAGTPGPILVLGLSFKENVPDLRNTLVVNIVARLRVCGYQVHVHDPVADADEARRLYDIELKPDLSDAKAHYVCVLGAVAHDAFRAFTTESFAALLAPGGLVADIKGLWRDVAMPAGIRRWTL
jgi:UDP-N-acetyl-D-galactosamine dehydrogenase